MAILHESVDWSTGLKIVPRQAVAKIRDGTETGRVSLACQPYSAGVTGNPFRVDIDPGGSNTLAKSIPRIESASDCDPPPDELR